MRSCCAKLCIFTAWNTRVPPSRRVRVPARTRLDPTLNGLCGAGENCLPRPNPGPCWALFARAASAWVRPLWATLAAPGKLLAAWHAHLRSFKRKQMESRQPKTIYVWAAGCERSSCCLRVSSCNGGKYSAQGGCAKKSNKLRIIFNQLSQAAIRRRKIPSVSNEHAARCF